MRRRLAVLTRLLFAVGVAAAARPATEVRRVLSGAGDGATLLKKESRTAIVTFSTGVGARYSHALAAHVRANRRAYCARHGYDCLL